MAGKSNTSATLFAQKKLLGKANTSTLKTDGEELIGSNIQAGTSLIFGEAIPATATRTEYSIQSASADSPGTIEYIPYILTVLTGTTYDANNVNPDGGAGSDSGESSQAAGPHAYKFVLPSDYESNSSNPRKGNGSFNNNKIVHETLGKIQIVPPYFSQQAPNPYIVKIYKDDGGGGVGDEIPLLDNIDWNIDYYNGILFLQDYDANKIPAHAKAFTYVGKMADEVISSGSSGGGGGGDSGASFLVLSATGSLSNERVFTPGIGLKSTDSGAGSSYTVDIKDSVVATLTGSQFSGNVGITGSFGVTLNSIFGNGVDLSGIDNNFFVSGAIDSRGTSTRGTSVFGGDLFASGTLFAPNGLSGSLTRLPDGSSYLVAGTGINISSASNGAITISREGSTPSPRSKSNRVLTGSIFSGVDVDVSSNFSAASFSFDRIDVFVNGQLMMSGNNLDYSLNTLKTGSIHFTFDLFTDDIVTTIVNQ